MGISAEGLVSCFICYSLTSDVCNAKLCTIIEYGVTIFWVFAFLFFTIRAPIVLTKKLLHTSTIKILYQWRKRYLFCCGYFTVIVGTAKSFLLILYNGNSLWAYVVVTMLDRLTIFGIWTMMTTLFISWIQILQVYRTLKGPNNKTLKSIIIPYSVSFLAIIFSLSAIEIFFPESALASAKIFYEACTFLGTIILIGMGVTGFSIYALLVQKQRRAPSKTIRKVSLLVFSSIIILIIIMGSILAYLVLGSNYVLFNTMYSGITGIAFVIFTLINGIGFSWETRDRDSFSSFYSFNFRKINSVIKFSSANSSISQ